MTDDPYSSHDARFEAARLKEPGLDYSTYYTRIVSRAIERGAVLNSLGKNLSSAEFEDIRDAARAKADKMIRLGRIKQTSRVIDYGCGSLRLGVHFIDLLDPGHYYGIDVIDDFMTLGREMLGEDYLAEKQPYLAAISPDSLDHCAAVRADYVFAHAVIVHLHPELIDEVFRNLQRLTNKPGARLAFNASYSTKPERLRPTSWSWPIDSYSERLPELSLVAIQDGPTRSYDGIDEAIGNATFIFERPA